MALTGLPNDKMPTVLKENDVLAIFCINKHKDECRITFVCYLRRKMLSRDFTCEAGADWKVPNLSSVPENRCKSDIDV